MAKTYDTYKDSGIKWLGTIPANWRIEKGKHVLSVLSKPVLQDDDVVTCFRDGEVVLRNERRTEGFTMSDKEIGYQHIDKGDIVIHGMDGFAGSIGISKSTGKGSPVLVVCNPIKDNPSYLVYYLRILANTNVFLSLSTGIRQRSCDLKWNKISVLPFPLPSLPEQRTITTYLDEKCGEIDTLISLQEEMISELQAYKQSVITEAVTKGLDSNVPMKDSGVEWIGMIPEGWKIQRLRTLGNCQNGISKGGEYFGDEFDFPFVNYTDAYKNIDVPYPEGRANSTEEDRKQYSLIEGDILFTRTSETIDEIGYASTCTQTIPNAVFSGFLIRFRPTGKELYYGFSKYYFRSSIHRAFFVKEMNLVTRASLSQNLLKNLPTLIPPLSEQQAIASYLDEKTSQIDSLIALKQEKITELKDYKKSIIYEYVTGKKKV